VDEVGYFKSGANELFYSVSKPAHRSRRSGIVFVHAGNGNRLGPHRMFVEHARKFADIGYPTLRFDLSGCGDSTGVSSQGNIDAEVFDLLNAIGFFRAKAGLEGVVLFGISRGAKVCYEAMVSYELPVKALVLLSIPVSSTATSLKSFAMEIRQYLYKLRERGFLLKLLRAEVEPGGICRTLMRALGLGRRYKRTKVRAFSTKAPVLFIYAERDPVAQASKKFYTAECLNNKVRYDCCFISRANHSFFHYRWKEQIFDLSREWLERVL